MGRADKQAQFFRMMAASSMSTLFDALPGVSFFAKNHRYELVSANQPFLHRLGLRSEPEIIGKTDFDLFPRSLAEHFRLDDEEVVKTRRPKLNIVELFINPDGLPDWYLTAKVPIFDRKGSAIGIMGMTQHYSYDEKFALPYSRLEPVVRFIQANYQRSISVADVAARFKVSPRHLDRRFQELLKMSPQEFIMRLRMKTACERLAQTRDSILDIALALGFYDQSSFTLQFRRRMGVTPLQFRKQRRNSTEIDQRATSGKA